MGRKYRKKLMTAAVNTGPYGTDAVQAGTPIAIQTRDLGVDPIVGDDVERELDNGKLGNSPVQLVGTHTTTSCGIEVAGSGNATTVPEWAILMNAAGYNESVEADHVLFSRASEGQEKDATIYDYIDGAYHILRGCRATFTTRIAVNEPAMFNFDVTGLFGGVAGSSIPAATFNGFQKPVKVGKTHTTLQIGGTEYKMLEFELSENNEIEYDENTVDEQVYLNDYKPEGRLVIEAPDIGSFDPFSIALSEVLVTLSLVHGTVGGNIVTISANEIQLLRPQYGDRNGRLTYEIPFRVIGEHTIRTE